MDTETRKRPANDSDNGGRTKARARARAREDDESRTATEEEVEEFFAILRRMHAAGRYFKKNNGNGLEITEKGVRWRPAFEWEDFRGLNAVQSDADAATALNGKSVGVFKKGEEKTEESALSGGFDLNAEPEPEHSGSL